MTGGDVRGFYEALGIELPGWAHTEAPVRCFADPDGHARGDRNPSCSVNLHSGAFNCHGCGARGGAYDAALARGRSSRDAIDLMVAYGLTERRPRDRSRQSSPASTGTSRPPARRQPRQRPQTAAPASVAVTGDQVQQWAQTLRCSSALLARLQSERGWSARALMSLQIGFDGERITVPIWRPATLPDRVSAERAVLQGVLRLRVDGRQHPKVIAIPGTRLGLLPPPGWTSGDRVLVVEGPGDMLAARSAGLPAVAVPGATAWRSGWAGALEGRTVVVVMDCDRPGRQAAARIAEDLERRGIAVEIGDLAPSRWDGYDVSDWLREGNPPTDLLRLRELRLASDYRPMTGLPAPAAAAASRPGSPRRTAGAAERPLGTRTRSAGCTTFS